MHIVKAVFIWVLRVSFCSLFITNLWYIYMFKRRDILHLLVIFLAEFQRHLLIFAVRVLRWTCPSQSNGNSSMNVVIKRERGTRKTVEISGRR